MNPLYSAAISTYFSSSCFLFFLLFHYLRERWFFFHPIFFVRLGAHPVVRQEGRVCLFVGVHAFVFVYSEHVFVCVYDCWLLACVCLFVFAYIGRVCLYLFAYWTHVFAFASCLALRLCLCMFFFVSVLLEASLCL